MATTPRPDPYVLDRLRTTANDVEWAALRLSGWQHVPVDDIWAAHQQVAHLIAVETENFQPRLARIRDEERPVLVSWDTEAFNAKYRVEGDIVEAAAQFTAERAKTIAMFDALTPEQWARTGMWPDGEEIDLGWLAEKVLWHGFDHLQQLLDLHGEFAKRQG